MSCKKSFHSARIKALIILIAIIHILGSNSFPKTQEHKDENFTIIITANLQGLYSTEIEDQEKEDTIITLAQSIVSESKEVPFDLYVDLGILSIPGLFPNTAMVLLFLIFLILQIVKLQFFQVEI